MVACPGHPELNVEKKKMLKKVWSYPVDFCPNTNTRMLKVKFWAVNFDYTLEQL